MQVQYDSDSDSGDEGDDAERETELEVADARGTQNSAGSASENADRRQIAVTASTRTSEAFLGVVPPPTARPWGGASQKALAGFLSKVQGNAAAVDDSPAGSKERNDPKEVGPQTMSNSSAASGSSTTSGYASFPAPVPAKKRSTLMSGWNVSHGPTTTTVPSTSRCHFVFVNNHRIAPPHQGG
jgi:hypothetical protein